LFKLHDANTRFGKVRRLRSRPSSGKHHRIKQSDERGKQLIQMTDGLNQWRDIFKIRLYQ